MSKEIKKREDAATEVNTPMSWRDIFIQYRGRISLVIALIGLALFLVQMMTTNRTARSDQAFTLLLMQDWTERNTFLENLDEDGTFNPEDLPPVDSHYRGSPNQGFAERFEELSRLMPENQRLHTVPVSLHISETESPEERTLPPYYVLKMKPEGARLLLQNQENAGNPQPGNQFIGPHIYSVPPSREQLQEAAGDRRMDDTPLRMDPSATAMQGFVVQVVEAVDANAYLLLPAGTMSVGDYAVVVNQFSKELTEGFRELYPEGERPDFAPNFRFSDIRHGSFVYFTTLLGQLIFMIGGFLLLYHFIEGYANRDHGEPRFFKRLIIGTCQLIRDNSKIYAVSILLFLLFWAYGMVMAHLDPAGQEEMIYTYQSMFSGSSWPLGFTAQSYRQGDILMASIMTFVVNFFWGTVVILTLFSLVPVGSAFIINAFRGQVIGHVLAPTKAFAGLSMVPHLITVVIELQAYLIAGFVSVLLPLAMMRPQRFGCNSVKEAFFKFALWQLKVLPLIGIILLIAAVYEALELILLRGLFF